jgi:hypothetical protein
MSTASEGIPTDHHADTARRPGALAILTATAVGGVLASRFGKAPLVLAAGAATLALLKHKGAAAPKPVPLPASEARDPPPPEAPAPSQIEQWLARQIDREAQAPLVTLPPTDVPEPEHEDDYHPQSFLIDDPDAPTGPALPRDTWSQLSEPVQPLPSSQIEPEPDLPEPTSLFQALEAPAPAPSADATWVLGVEPLPSLNEGTAFPSVASSMFASAPGQNEEQAFPPPQFTPPTFQGAAFPDEIEVAAPPEPAHELSPPVVHITPTLPPSVNFPAAAAESESRPDDAPPVAEIVAPQSEAPEIAVHLAATGEASFDPPLLADVPDNPWQPAPELSSTPPVAPPPAPPMNGPVVDAEIVLRPRAPMQNAVVAKTKPVSPRFAKNEPQAETHDIPPADNKQAPVLPPAPVQTPREQRARSTWRSWWRGE